MISKEELWAAIANEFRIIKHLAEKIPADHHHHKPTEKQRTTLELLQFLSSFGIGCLNTFFIGDIKAFGSHEEKSKLVTVENFAAALDAQEAEMKIVWAKFTDEELMKEINVFGRMQSKKLYLLDLLKMFVGYKMQLFLYVKQSGVHTISTANVWAGMDMPNM